MTLATAAATAISVAGTLYSGFAAQASANFNAKVASNNAKLAEANAVRRIGVAQNEQLEQDNLTRAMIGEQVAAQGASGLAISSPSFIRTRNAAARLGRLDAIRVREEGELDASNFRQQAVDFRNQASQEKASGKASLISSFFKAGSLIGNATPTMSGTSTVPRPVARHRSLGKPINLLR